MTRKQFDYEEKYAHLQAKLKELQELSSDLHFDLSGELEVMGSKLEDIRSTKYQNLSPWEKVLLSRHPERPTTQQYINFLCEDWMELHGDRLFGDDQAIIGGIASFQGIPITVLGHQKGGETNERVRRNFGMAHPEGYRKALRLLQQAEKFQRPVLNFIDTPGAYPGVGAEERGQALAISQLLMTLSRIHVPVISIVIGEGGSGGALALAVGDRLLMLSNTVFSVASAEACASILWKDAAKAEEMASALRLTPQDLMELGIIDEIIEEPVGGAHQDVGTMAARIKTVFARHLNELLTQDREILVQQRYNKIRKIGKYREL